MNKVEQYFFSAGDSQFATEGLLPLLPLEFDVCFYRARQIFEVQLKK